MLVARLIPLTDCHDQRGVTTYITPLTFFSFFSFVFFLDLSATLEKRPIRIGKGYASGAGEDRKGLT